MSFVVPKFKLKITEDSREISCKAMGVSAFRQLKVSSRDDIAAWEA
jgi:hypothetical protein